MNPTIKKNWSTKNIRVVFAIFVLMMSAFFLSFATYSHAITISGTETITTNSNATYTATGCNGTVTWGVTGTGASINNGVLKTTSPSCGVITVAARCSDGTTAIKQLRVANGGQWTIVASCNNEKMWQGLCGITNWQTCGNCQAWSGSAIIINEGNFQATQFISQITRTSGQNRYTTRWYAIYENGTGCNSLITECCPSYDSIAPIDHCCENVKECAAYPYSHTGPDACLFSQHERWVCSSCSDNDNDGYTTCNGDCDDANPNIKPGAPEICGDLIDNNCNGQVDEGCEKILKYVSGSGQEDFICKTLQNPFVVSVSGTTQGSVGVNWQITEAPSGSNASIIGETSTFADSEIISSAYLKLGSLPGNYNAEARCSECTSGSPQKFTATAKCPEVPVYYQSDYKEPYDKWCKIMDNSKPPKVIGKGVCQCEKFDNSNPPKVIGEEVCQYENGNLKPNYKLKSNYMLYSIKDIGCALASASMVMKWYEYELGGKFVDPVSLNGLMNDTEDGYINGGFSFDKVEEVSRPQLLLTYKKDADRKSNKPLDKSYMDKIDEYLKKCIPVIVRVYNSTTRNTHFVVVTEKIGDDYIINDPGYKVKPRTRLSDPAYGSNIYGIRVYENKKGACEQ